MHIYDRPICVFLDGFDEHLDANDDVTQLLCLVQKLAQAENTVFCLSSRPEPSLQKQLAVYARLRLQDLTWVDLTWYAEGHLLSGYLEVPKGKPGYEKFDVVGRLVDKAEGVFLWLTLAIKKINKGFTIGDDFDTIQKRIEYLPAELHNLYRDMWEKACGNNPEECRSFAALYFELVMLDSEMDTYPSKFGVLDMMLASTSITEIMLGSCKTLPRPPSADILLKQCQETERRVAVYCAGLLELAPSDEYWISENWHGGDYDQLLPFTGHRRHFRFIHRTASDFLLDTAEGQSILIHCSLLEFDLHIQLNIAFLARSCLIFPRVRDGVESQTPSSNSVSHVLGELRSLRRKFEGSTDWNIKQWNQLLLHCERLSKARRLYMQHESGKARVCEGYDFLPEAASFSFIDYVHSRLLFETCGVTSFMLREYKYSLISDQQQSTLVRELLKAGADPRLRGPLRNSVEGSVLKEPSYSSITLYMYRVLFQYSQPKDDNSAILCVVDALLAHGLSDTDLIGLPLNIDPSS